jgi:F0F1-type ATP synthase membrane subunit c/vacuolar-type H+-ATPase subunit K
MIDFSGWWSAILCGAIVVGVASAILKQQEVAKVSFRVALFVFFLPVVLWFFAMLFH